MLQAQELSGQYTTEWQWDMNKNTNWVNLLRLDLSVPLGSDRNTIEAATLHLAKTGESVIGDWQGFSNIDADNMLASIAVLGFMHQWNSGHLFIGVRNVNEDFFTSPITALFTNSSCGIFPTVAASYPIANYPFSGLTLYFDITKKGWTFRNSLYNGSGYNGWTAHDNPFLIKPKTDGIFNMSQIEYTHRSGEYYAGIAVHTRQQPFVTEDETASTMTQTNGTRQMRIRRTKPRRMRIHWHEPPLPGGSMESRSCGHRAKRISCAWCNIQRIQAARTPATAMQR